MKKSLLFFLITYASIAKANYPEFFGASFSTTSIGNQSNMDSNDPSNNYYAPAILGFSKKTNMLIQATSTSTHFAPMNNIVVANKTNSSSALTIGNVSNDYQTFQGSGIHLSTPVGYEHLGTIGLSLFTPIGNLMDSNTGDPFQPEYVMYHSRYQRTNLYFNFSRKWNEQIAWSLGTHMGYQADATINTNLSLNGSPYGSWARARAKISPTFGAITSIAYEDKNTHYYFSYQQEMKSKLDAMLSGEVSDPISLPFSSIAGSMMYYDPHTFRFGSTLQDGDVEYFGSVEYQLWSNYTPPTISFSRLGGVLQSSNNFEKLTLQNTFNPKIGLKYNFTGRLNGGIGFAYRMTPILSDFSGSGNSIDTNTYIFTTGIQYRIVIWSKDVNVGTSIEYQQLEKKHVVKTLGAEDGTAPTDYKIGAGGYDIDGHIIAASFGIKFNF